MHAVLATRAATPGWGHETARRWRIRHRNRHAFIEGKPTGTYGYSAPILGPVMRVQRGDEVQVTVENALNTVTTVHWHGLLAPGYNDGGPQQLIQPGENWRPVLT